MFLILCTSIVSVMNLVRNTKNTQNTRNFSQNPCKEPMSKNTVLGIPGISNTAFSCSICNSLDGFIIENGKNYCPNCLPKEDHYEKI